MDFLIVEDNCNVLIDAKAVEMSPLGRLSHDAEQLTKAVSASVKAMGQGMAVMAYARYREFLTTGETGRILMEYWRIVIFLPFGAAFFVNSVFFSFHFSSSD